MSDGVWFSEVEFERWVAGRVAEDAAIKLPPGEIPVAGRGEIVVTVVRGTSESTIKVFDLRTNEVLAETQVDFNIGGAAISADASTVYVAGVTGDQSISDAGVVAISVKDSSATKVLEPLGLRPEWQGSAARGEPVLSTSGDTLASTLCGGPLGAIDATCDIQVLSVSDGSLQQFGPVDSYLVAVTDTVVVTRTERSMHGFDFNGRELWRFDAGEIRGPVAATPDGAVFAYVALETFVPTRVGRLLADSGTVEDLIVSDGDLPLAVWPDASDASIVVVADGPPMEFALAGGRQVSISTIELATNRVTRDALTIEGENGTCVAEPSSLTSSRSF